MSPSTEDLVRIVLIGAGATAIMDAWLWLLARVGMPTLDFGLVGRWIAHGARGRWKHDAIANAAPVQGERLLGWLTHYAVGIGFAAALVALRGAAWTRSPSLLPALAVGIATVAFPFLVMQPAMGAGVASARTRTPARNRVKSVANHAVFGAGLYLAALLLARAWP